MEIVKIFVEICKTFVGIYKLCVGNCLRTGGKAEENQCEAGYIKKWSEKLDQKNKDQKILIEKNKVRKT
jgi:hypothetical protein